MNIAAAKKQVENALRVYLVKDEFGEYVLPVESQRPVFLMGPPGIGKTAIMTQVAHELGIGLVSYSMTHHTRQSALGLPYIDDEEFGGRSYRTSHYTMSEIIATVHELIEATGHEEGILFLDEVNCVSETLAPAMLQFLQFKTFGQHKVPQGWVIVTAGNPPEYNNSVREFDIVTWDRLKRVNIEPDYEAWRAYALTSGVHASVLTYLELKKANFYKVQATVEGKRFVTARGWVDLSLMIGLYEQEGIEVDLELVSQYVQDDDIAHDFNNYYQLFNKYKADYQVSAILEGRAGEAILERAGKAPFDERLSLVGMIADACMAQVAACVEQERLVSELLSFVRGVKEAKAATPVAGLLEEEVQRQRADLRTRRAANTLTRQGRRDIELACAFLTEALDAIAAAEGDPYEVLKRRFNERLERFKASVDESKAMLDNAFTFLEAAFSQGQEVLIFVTELTANDTCAGFISRYGCDQYFRHNKDLLFYERQKEIVAQLADLDL